MAASDLTWPLSPANTKRMAYSFLIFDFGSSEDVAQQARHRIDGWKQGFRLDKKLQMKFDRKEAHEKPEAASTPAPNEAKSTSKAKPGSKAKSDSGSKGGTTTAATAPASEIRMIVRLDFSDHEKLSHQRWLERIPGEEPFKAAKPRIVRPGDPDFVTISDQFDSLD